MFVLNLTSQLQICSLTWQCCRSQVQNNPEISALLKILNEFCCLLTNLKPSQQSGVINSYNKSAASGSSALGLGRPRSVSVELPCGPPCRQTLIGRTKNRVYMTRSKEGSSLDRGKRQRTLFGLSNPFCFNVSSISSLRFVNQLTAKVLHCSRRVNEAWTVTDRLTGLPVAPTHQEHMAEEHMAEEHTSVVQSDRVAV